MQEVLVKAHDRAEFLGMLGVYGAALSFVQVGKGSKREERKISV